MEDNYALAPQRFWQSVKSPAGKQSKAPEMVWAAATDAATKIVERARRVMVE